MPVGLNIPDYPLKCKTSDDGELVFDPVRGKYVRSTPEELVRQRIIAYLHHDLGWPLSLMRSEHGLRLNGQLKRVDLSVHDNQGTPIMLVECKAPHVRIDQRTFEQAARYNITMRVPYLLLTNGLQHYCCGVDHENGSVGFMNEVPTYELITEVK